ncbi:MAG: clostripain-related cysteine peptidase [Tannerellaceae bacterium]|nr:clostripain-related cysteine peptidase [Tannerellaceae bacterium]
MYKLVFLLVCSCLFMFFSCEKNNEPSPAGSQRTLLVYLARDTKDLLSELTEEKIDAIVQGWDGKGGHILVYEDKLTASPALYRIVRSGDTNTIEIIETYPEENSASKEVLSRVIQKTVSLCPADSYGMIFFSHGSGWLPEHYFGKGTLPDSRSIGTDGDTELEITDLAAAIPDGLFDFIIFEACFSAGIELVYELKNKTNYIVGSSAEIVSPGFREIYKKYINYLFYPEADLQAFTEKAFEHVNSQSGAYQSGTLSLIRTAGIDPLAGWLKNNITQEFSGSYNQLQHFDRKTEHLFYDFEDYFSHLVNENQRATLSGLISDCIVYKASTPGFFEGYDRNSFVISSHSGLTTYILKDDLADLNEYYKRLGWYQAIFRK